MNRAVLEYIQPAAAADLLSGYDDGACTMASRLVFHATIRHMAPHLHQLHMHRPNTDKTLVIDVRGQVIAVYVAIPAWRHKLQLHHIMTLHIDMMIS